MNLNELDDFYRATTFMVYQPDGRSIPIRVGQLHPCLDELVAPIGVSWAFLTASNPRSTVLPEQENDARNRGLVEAVSSAGYTFWRGAGISDFSDWKPEESILVAGMSRDTADLFAEQYDQNAFVYGEIGGVAELIWTRSPARLQC